MLRNGSHRLFFLGTASVTELHMLCAWHENSEERNCLLEEVFLYSLKLYKLCWSIDKYMVREHIGD